MTSAHARALEEAAEKCDGSKNYFDIHAMKRRFGAPPVLGSSDVFFFDEFIVSLANCMDQGDSVVATLIYQYGLEQYKIIELLRWRGDAINIQHTLAIQEKTAAADATQTRDGNGGESKGTAHKNNETGAELTNSPPPHPLGKTDLLRAGKEIRLAERVEHGLDNYARIDRLILECSKRANALMKQIESHSRYVAERLNNEYLLATIDAMQYGHVSDAELSTGGAFGNG